MVHRRSGAAGINPVHEAEFSANIVLHVETMFFILPAWNDTHSGPTDE